VTLPDNDTLAKLAADATPGPWSTDCMEIHGKKYGGLWVRGADVVEDDGHVGPLMVKLTGSHGAASYTGEIVAAQDHDDNDANARLIALAPSLAAKVIALRKRVEAADAMAEALESIGMTCVTDSFYKDCTLSFVSPHALTMRLHNDSTKSFIVADFENRRVAALAAYRATGAA
jgi:hypothetical protein